MFELTINDKVYPFNFGVGFVREINKTVKIEMSGVTEDAGLTMALTHIYDGDVVDLVNVLDLANKGKSPRVTKQELEAYIEAPDTDIDKLFDDVFFHDIQRHEEEGGEAVQESGSSSDRVTSFEETYQEIALNCFRYLDFKSFDQVDQLTIPQYTLMMKAAMLKQVDLDYRNHLQAWLTFAAKAERKAGRGKTRPVYTTFQKFFNYKDSVANVLKSSNPKQRTRFRGIEKVLKKGGKDDG